MFYHLIVDVLIRIKQYSTVVCVLVCYGFETIVKLDRDGMVVVDQCFVHVTAALSQTGWNFIYRLLAETRVTSVTGGGQVK